MKLITIALVLIGALALAGCEENMPAPGPTPAQEPPEPAPSDPDDVPSDEPPLFALSDKPTSFNVGVGPDVRAGELWVSVEESFIGGEWYDCAEPSASWISRNGTRSFHRSVTATPDPANDSSVSIGDSATITCTATANWYTPTGNPVYETLSVTYTFTVVRRTRIQRKIETATFKLAPTQPRHCHQLDREDERECYLFRLSSEFPVHRSTSRIRRTNTPSYPISRGGVEWLTISIYIISGNPPATLTADIPYCPPYDSNLQACSPDVV